MLATMIRIGLMIISWSTVIFLPKKSFMQFLPATLFTTVILLVENLLGTTHKWWKVNGGQRASANNALTFILGPFFMANMWVFHLTYKKFGIYFILNLVIDLLFAFPMEYGFRKLNIFKLKKFKNIHLFLTAFSYSLLSYGFQKVMDTYHSKSS